ncbi:SWI/SNF-related matrix-associated actin-dependent regulator of chromatin subfamily A containing DEAD/H box 1 homolog isoform X2 [Sabethes cyaneus]|uniref:SWI/SNF-related matrix-associated actin-dependent regulator of chromatin subfamily A containing DEAD/H box 1 homolog isoform X2 n=1 Tax=Sabethes cyaneus TaxID=53552 RepID=UPI00237D563C|nr:SWI/SNF-related matrix-associated actin-dependent regulator of chromatin subfamily A containing DEAD/H box 1 homolog isoform X2 [Sabethes cyaneus]
MSLRQYRKPTHSGLNGTTSTLPTEGTLKLEPAPGRLRIQTLADSESESETTPAKSPTTSTLVSPVPIPTVGAVSVPSAGDNAPARPQNGAAPSSTGSTTTLTVKEKELCLQKVRGWRPDVDTMVVQDALVQNNWSVERALEQLKDYSGTKKRILDTSPATIAQKAAMLNVSSKPNAHPSKKRRVMEENAGSDSEENSDRPQECVFDSDDESDADNYTMSRDRKGVFEFLNKATVNELSVVKTLSTKKIELLTEMRPFNNWDQLVDALKSHKSLKTDILNHTQEYLTRRNNLVTILNKCRKMVQKLEAAIAVGGGLIEQPSNIPEGFKLAEYQMVGLNWLTMMHRNDMNGILADEMGLGKTIQVIAFLAHLKENELNHQPQLIVVPSSTLDNWDNELRKWCPELIVMKYYGNQEERRCIRIDWAKNGISDVDVVLTTYHMMGASGEEKKMWRVTPFQYVIFDEAHMLKNMTTQRYENLLRIRAERRILLTGTPLQNNLLELMSLLCFVMPKLFGGKIEDIKALFQGKIKSGEDKTTFEKNQIERAKQIMKPFILRRLKRDVLSFLPPKTENIIKATMLDSQKEKYHALVNEYQDVTGVVKSYSEVSGMSIMMDMRKLANHPLLLRYYFSDDDVRKIARKLAADSDWKGNNIDETFQDIAYLSDFKLYQLKLKYTSLYDLQIPDKLILASGKFRQLDELLPKLKSEGHRVLIFSQFVMMLDILEKYLDIRKYGYLRLDGQTAVTERQEMIDQYTQDPNIFVFLLSTRAGGLGINLTAADTVIIHDIDFNPYNDKQAEDRSHRMGQTKPVTIYKLISEGTIEEGMLMIAQEKLQLEKDVTEEGADKKEEHKCMVRLLTMALGMDENKAETILKNDSPRKKLEEEEF